MFVLQDSHALEAHSRFAFRIVGLPRLSRFGLWDLVSHASRFGLWFYPSSLALLALDCGSTSSRALRALDCGHTSSLMLHSLDSEVESTTSSKKH